MISGSESGFSRQAEATLIEQAQAGSQEGMNLLLLRHEGLVHWVVQRQWLYILPFDAAVQEGRRGLWRAILGYEPKRGVKFSTYAYQAIMKYVWAAVKSERRRMRRRIAREVLVLYFYDPGVDPAWLREREEVVQSLWELVNRLPGPQAEVIRMHYGLDGRAPKTHAEIAAQMGVSRQRIGQIETEALTWLRQPAHSQELRSLLARHSQQQYELADQLAQAWLRRRGGRRGRR
jgi:RNA polymerase sporulation-specific sigma factor